MATRILPVISLACLTVSGLIGCQSGSDKQAYAAPSFDGPMIAAYKTPIPTYVPPIAPRPMPPARPPVVPVLPPSPPSLAAVPSGWIPPVAPRPWKWIIIHHSATTTGGALAFDKMHRAKGWDELGYDFVIGNGTDTANGQIEVGPRWAKQKIGAHARTADNRFNEFGIGICLVGNFNLERPTPEQLKSVDKLVAYLMATYHISADHVMGHRDTKSTECPGTYMYADLPLVRQQAGYLASHAPAVKTRTAAAVELLTSVAPAQ